jgi:TM2 domain-containing membrane protein YozV
MHNSPPAPGPDSVRIGTTEREDAARVLGDHFAEGRLHTDEYELRLSAAYAATTLAELRPLFEDLPLPRPTCLNPPPPPGFSPPHAAPPPHSPMMSDKSKVTAGLLQIFLPFGIGRFYTGHIGIGIAQLLLVILSCGVLVLWPIIDGIVLLASGGTDHLGRRLRD